jgi:hypothetical protein
LARQEVPPRQVAPAQGPLLQVTLSVGCPGGVHWLVPPHCPPATIWRVLVEALEELPVDWDEKLDTAGGV